MKRITRLITGSLVTVVAMMGLISTVSITTAGTAYANTNADKVQSGVTDIGGGDAGNKASDLTAVINNVINLLLFIIGVIAVIMIIVGGIRYTTSAGDQAQVTGAKNTILYAIVGLVVAVMSYALVNFVLTKV